MAQQYHPPGDAAAALAARTQPTPRLASVSPAIFSPIEGDELLIPFTPPASRVERLQSKLLALEINRGRVRANLIALCRRECARIFQEAQADEAAMHQQQRRGSNSVAGGGGGGGSGGSVPQPTEEELDAMVANITAGPRDDKTVSLSAAGLPDFGGQMARSKSEWWVLQLEITLSKGLRDLQGYDRHVAAIRQGLAEALERERRVAMEIG